MTLAHKRGYLIYGIIKQLIYKNVLKVSRNISNGCFQFSNQKPVAASFFSQPSSKKSHYFTPMSQQWRLGAMPPCSNPISADKNGPPSRLEGVWHLITFKGMLSSYVVGSTAVGYYMAPGPCDVKKLMVCCGGTALTVLSANAFNQIYESESDALMQRTSRRYLPSGGCMGTATAFAVLTGAAGGAILWKYVNPLASSLAVFNIALYGAVYTPLKQIHWFNTWVGSIVGAIPPMIGWAAKTNGAELGSWVLGGLLFFWQMPHFHAIAWKNQDDYERGNYKMLVNTDRDAVPGVAFRYSLPLMALGPLSYMSGMTTPWFCLTSFFPSTYGVLSAYPFYTRPSADTARSLFFSSLLTLPAFCALLVLHRTNDPTAFEKASSALRSTALSVTSSLGFPSNFFSA